jgi:cyclic pyranopterin phosphate synthase
MAIFAASFKKLKGLQTVAITTNGLVLTHQLVGLQRAWLDVLNVNLDTAQLVARKSLGEKAGNK